MVNKASNSGRRSVLDMLQQYAPATYTMLHRPVTGQGGYQSRLRTMQGELGIQPNEQADYATPASRQTFHANDDEQDRIAADIVTAAGTTRTGRQLPPKAAVVAGNVDREHNVIEAARMLKQAGETKKAIELLASLIGQTAAEISERQTQNQDTDDDAAEVADLDAMVAKGKARRQEKATLRAAGRQRRSPKLTDNSKAQRSYRMFLLHHDGRTAAAKMRQKFGADWKKLIK
jgi:hypothetical protein